jgi:integrase
MATRNRADKFPLWWHKGAKAWCKKIRGRFYYFGADREQALAQYVEAAKAIKEGREPRADVGAVTVAELVNHFLTARRERVDSRELTAAMWGEYFHMAEQVIATFGRGRVVADLRPDDFGRLRAAAAKRLGPVALHKFITMARTLFKFAFTNELIDAPVRYGDRFDKPPKGVLRLHRAQRAAKLIPAADFWQLHDRADPQFRAMLLLALNCGFGQMDCSGLERRAIDTRPGWVNWPRRKSGVGRRAPLWPETVAALDAVRLVRPDPKDPTDAGLVFLTVQGNRWCRYVDPEDGTRGHNVDTVGRTFLRLSRACGLKVPGGFYTLRHTFRTVADEVKDRPAIDLVMGHADHSMASYYREQIGDDRLQAVVDHVRRWLLAGKPVG